MTATAVYRFYDVDGGPVYFGSARNPEVRWRAHQKRSWWPEVDMSRTRVDWYPNQPAAALAETEAITAEQPRRNVVGTPRHGAALIHPVNLAAFGGHKVLGNAEIARGLNVNRQRVHQLATLPGFPQPVVILAMGKVWLRTDIEKWARDRQMRLTGSAEDSER